MSLNQDLIRARCQEIEEFVGRLEAIKEGDRGEFLKDQDLQDIACYRLLIAIEAALSLCYHVTAKKVKKVYRANMLNVSPFWRRQGLSERICPSACKRWPASATYLFIYIGKLIMKPYLKSSKTIWPICANSPEASPRFYNLFKQQKLKA